MFNTPVEIHRRYDLKGSWAGELIVDGASQPVLLENSLGGKVEKVDNEHFGGLSWQLSKAEFHKQDS